VVGDGPDEASLRALVADRDDVRFHGWCERDRVRAILAGARALVLPSRWFEGFPITLLESLATGRPVIASDHGAFTDTVVEGRSGWRFAAGDDRALAQRLAQVARLPGDVWQAACLRARAEFDAHYGPAMGYARLRGIYDAALERFARRG